MNSTIDHMLKDILPIVYNDVKALIMKDVQPMLDQAQVKMEVYKRKADELKDKAVEIEHKVQAAYHNNKWLMYPVALLLVIPYLAMIKYILLVW